MGVQVDTRCYWFNELGSRDGIWRVFIFAYQISLGVIVPKLLIESLF